MFRRIASILALVGFIAGQWAAAPHAHAGMEVSEHGSIPHVHLSSRCAHPSHDHGCGEHHHVHHEADGEHVTSCGVSCIAGDHDADVIYVQTTVVSAAGRSDSHSLKLLLTILHFSSNAELICSAAELPSRHSPLWRDSAELAPHCALYVKLRSLRI